LDLLVKYGYEQDADFFVQDLQSTVTQFGLAIRVCCVLHIFFVSEMA